VGTAVYVTELPRQNGFVGVAMETLTGRLGLTVIVTALLVAGFPVGQRVSEVRIQVTISPLFGMEE
jgi:hypothetical protein